jgi:alpha-glucosidase
MGFTEGEPWLPLAAEHRGLSVQEQAEDPDSVLSFSREMIALRKATPPLTLGDIEFAGAPEPVVAFVRRHEDEEVVCVFNFSADPQVFAHPSLERTELLPLRTGEADLRGGSLGLSPYAACFLRLV